MNEEEEEEETSSNQAPTADVAVRPDPPSPGTQVTLDGSDSSDPDGDDVTFSWTLNTPSESSASLSSQSTEQPTFTPDVAGDYTATLTVDDGEATDDATTTITASSTKKISDDITSDRTLVSTTTYIVTTTVEVTNNSTLTIEAGTEVNFQNGVALWINSGSAIDANGTSDNPVTMTATAGNEQQGWWRGLAIYSGNIDNSLEYTEVRHAGRSDMARIGRAANVAVDDGATLNITNSTLATGSGHGLHLDSGATLEAFAENSFSGNANAPVSIPFTAIGALDSGSSFADGTTIRVNGGTIEDGDATVSALSNDTPYRFVDRSEFGGGTLTIDPGVEMTFMQDEQLWVDSGAAIDANGTSDNPVTMTATEGNEQQGWWRGLAIYSNNTDNSLEYTEVRHAGRTDMGGIGRAANVTVDDGATLNITNSTLATGGGHGLHLDSGATLESFAGNSFSGNANAAVSIPFTAIGALDSGSSFAEDTTIRVNGGAIEDGDATVSALSNNTPYRFVDRPEFGGGTLTIEPGVAMTFVQDEQLSVESGATIDANGTSDNPVTMTATEGNEQQGWWRGLAIYSNNTDNSLEYTEVRHAGRTDMGGIGRATNIALDGGAVLNLTNATITDSGGDGVYCDGSNATLNRSDNSFSDNAGSNVANCQ